MKIQDCRHVAERDARSLCMQSMRDGAVRRAVDLLLRAPGAGGLEGPASDCAATAEEDCSHGGHPSGIDTFEYDDGICVWTCFTGLI